jgi:aspartyl-tRNA(Asn)/glutamyl-tRNA(Gln) amidotransferase subunit A
MNSRQTLVADPGAIARLRDDIARGARDPRAMLEAALARIDAAEPAVQGFRLIDRERARAEAAALSGTGPLHGIPVAVKDVIDVAGWPTRAGSRSRADAAPCSADAHVVTRLRAAGAVIVGKAHTTEFAFFDGPPPTRNPYDLSRTPGGSSSGPAAVVASGMVPLSLGTQTAGSISRPAAYCGIAAFKPSSRSWSSFGVVPFAPSFDTVGVFGYRVADAAVAARALMPEFMAPAGPSGQLRIAILDDPLLQTASPATGSMLRGIVAALGAGGIGAVEWLSPVSLTMLNAVHLLMREYELGHVHAALLDTADGMVTPSLREAVARGRATERARYLEAVATLAAAREDFWTALADCDALIFPAAPDVAPVGMATGDARFVVPFTALGGPIMSIPAGFDAGLPLGVMLCGAPGSDRTLLAIAERVAPLIETPR